MYETGILPRRIGIAEAHNYRWKNVEQDLVDWWLAQSVGHTNLITSEGEYLIVMDAGEGNAGPGPDVLNCHIIMGDIEMAGSVEMHRRASDWFRHHHDVDSNYDHVILHVVEEIQGGPDMATLVVQQEWRANLCCPARRPVNYSELLELALLRFQKKVDHLDALSLNESIISPLLLGMIEIILAGSQRHRHLQEVAIRLGLEGWPDAKIWQGSNQSYPQSLSRFNQIENLIKHRSLFDPVNWHSQNFKHWTGWDRVLDPLIRLGVSHNQSREWVVNILAAFQAKAEGFELWMELPVFRHYGSEKQARVNLGLSSVSNIIVQQAILQWQNQYCSQSDCSVCPLAQCH
ncbi:DUF2851 family protein [bacterium]|nr:DUF2851 family protein [bacterium]